MDQPTLRIPIVTAAVTGLMSALGSLQATPAERASVARSVYITVLLDLVRMHPELLGDAQVSMATMSESLQAMIGCESVEALTAWAQQESMKSTFAHADAPVVG